MNINMTGRHVEITDELRAHCEDRLRHALADFARIEHVHVILILEKHRHIAELDVQGPGFHRVEAKEEMADMYASFDAALDKVVKQLRRWTEKVHDSRVQHEGLGRAEARSSTKA